MHSARAYVLCMVGVRGYQGGRTMVGGGWMEGAYASASASMLSSADSASCDCSARHPPARALKHSTHHDKQS